MLIFLQSFPYRVSLDIAHPNTYWCGIAGKTCDMHEEEKVEMPGRNA